MGYALLVLSFSHLLYFRADYQQPSQNIAIASRWRALDVFCGLFFE